MDRSPDHRDTKHELELRTSRNEKEEEEEERKTRWHTCRARSANTVRSIWKARIDTDVLK